jgi:hypothetical protein
MAYHDRFLEFCEKVLALDASVIFSALVDHIGDIVALAHRETPFVDEREAKQYAIQMTIAAILLAHFENRVGSIQYTVTYHEGIARVTLPVAAGGQKFYVLLLMEPGSDVVSVVKNKVSPFVMSFKEIF